MKWFKRTWLSIVRRPAKSFLLFLVVFLMANLLAGSLAIIQTSKNIKADLKESIAPKVVFNYDYEYTEDRVNKLRFPSLQDMNQYVDIIDQLSKDDQVLSVEQHFTTRGIAYYRDLGWPEIDNRSMGFTIYSTNVINGTKFVDGDHLLSSLQGNRFLTEEELASDEICIVVDSTLGSVYELFDGKVSTGLNKIGNEVKMSLVSPIEGYNVKSNRYEIYEYPFTAKIVGVLFNKSKDPYDCVYMSNQALLNLIHDANEYFDSIGVNPIDYQLDSTLISMDSIENVETFVNDNQSVMNTMPEGFVYESSYDKYKKNAGPVENLDTIAKFVFIISVLATFIILGLVIVFFMGDRKKEIGVYLSVGERKKYIISQMLCEVVLVATLAIGCASISGLFLGDKLSNYMLEVQRYVQREQALGDIAKYKQIYTPIKNGISLQTRDDVINNYKVQANAEYFLIIFIVGEMSVMISSILPMVYLSSFKPKEIML